MLAKAFMSFCSTFTKFVTNLTHTHCSFTSSIFMHNKIAKYTKHYVKNLATETEQVNIGTNMWHISLEGMPAAYLA